MDEFGFLLSKVDDIVNVVKECEEVQYSGESRYTKQCAIESAYKQILKILVDAGEIDMEDFYPQD